MSHPDRFAAAWHNFVDTPLDAVLQRHHTVDPQQAALALFHEVAATVPAYAAFLAAQGVDPAAVQDAAAWSRLPLTTKPTYIQAHPLPALCRGGDLSGCDMVAVSSGSSGQPTFWPRASSDELAVARRFEQVFIDSFAADRRPTLAVICFALGTWVGGLYTAAACRWLATKGYPITVIAPGSQIGEILRVVAELGPHFEQVVLLGYPPFLKEVVDTGAARGLVWADYHIKLVLAGEVVSEEWRTLLGARTGGTAPPYDSAALYGTADAGVLGNETPLSIAIRRWLAERPALAQEIFGELRLPTLLQYDPLSRFFEVVDGTLLFTGDNGVPLIRYHIADTGGIIGYKELLARLAADGFDPSAALAAWGGRGVRALPFVYVFGRAMFTVSYWGANVYPENIAVGLEQPGISPFVTGKFVMSTPEDAARNRSLQIAVELAPAAAPSAELAAEIAATILAQLLRLNSEFAAYVPAHAQLPQVTLHPTGDPTHFPAGVKHRYTRP